MAERRAIKSSIWDDEFFGGELSLLEKLIWIGLFSKCADNQGRMLDNPTLIRSSLFPYGNATTEEIEKCLVNFGDKIIRYESSGRKYIQLKKWWENQPLQWAVPSNYPAPENWLDRVRTNYKGHKLTYNWGDTPDTPEGLSLKSKIESLGRVSTWTDYVEALNTNTNTKPNSFKKEVVVEVVVEPLPPLPNIFSIYEQEIGVLTPFIADTLDDIEKTYPENWFEKAVKHAKMSSPKVSINYIIKILERWKAEGLPSNINDGNKLKPKAANPVGDWIVDDNGARKFKIESEIA